MHIEKRKILVTQNSNCGYDTEHITFYIIQKVFIFILENMYGVQSG